MDMPGELYRLNWPSLAIRLPAGRQSILTLPAGAIVTVLNQPSGGARLVDLAWDGLTVRMFASDLQDHAERLTVATAN